MKVLEILHAESVAESHVIERIRAFDWNCEFSDDLSRFSASRKELGIIENQVYQLWKRDPEAALRAWNENVPHSPLDKSATPSFIFRLEAQET
jgi:hypothetical protein